MKSLFVLITGASRGIGKETAVLLSKQGFNVFAGVRKSSDVDALRGEANENLIPILLDVTNQEVINTSVKEIAKSTGNNLFALINNAGMLLGGPLEIVSLPDMQRLINVNVMGVLGVTKTFIPLLRNEGGGRIINIGSAAGYAAPPGLSAYSASKHALRGLTDSLRLELCPFNIMVSLLTIGRIDTPMWSKALTLLEKTVGNVNKDIHKIYTPLLDFQKKFTEESKGIAPESIAIKISQILNDKNPKGEYLLGADVKAIKLLNKLSARLLDKIILQFITKF